MISILSHISLSLVLGVKHNNGFIFVAEPESVPRLINVQPVTRTSVKVSWQVEN